MVLFPQEGGNGCEVGMRFLIRPGAFRDPEFVVAIRKVRLRKYSSWFILQVHAYATFAAVVRTHLATEVQEAKS